MQWEFWGQVANKEKRKRFSPCVKKDYYIVKWIRYFVYIQWLNSFV